MSKVLNVFYGTDLLPYKDKELQVHFPIVGQAFQGSSQTNAIKFYIDNIGDEDTTWVAVAKLPNGQIGFKQLEVDNDDNGNYAYLQLSNWFTQYKGDLYINLQSYDGGIEFVEDEETHILTPVGDPIIEVTGSVKLTIAYATQIVDGREMEVHTLQEFWAALGTKLNKNSRHYFKVVDNINSINYLQTYQDYLVNGDVVYSLDQKNFYSLSGTYGTFVATPIDLKLNNLVIDYLLECGSLQTVTIVVPHPEDISFGATEQDLAQWVDEKLTVCVVVNSSTTQLSISDRDLLISNKNVGIYDEDRDLMFRYIAGSPQSSTYRYKLIDLTNISSTEMGAKNSEILLNPTTRAITFVNNAITITDTNVIYTKMDEQTGHEVRVSIDSNYDLKVELLNADNEVISSSDVDLPLESIVVSADYYDSYEYQGTTYNQVIVITLATTDVPTIIPVGDLVDGLVDTTTFENALDTKLNKQSGATAHTEVYAKTTNGTQAMISTDDENGTVVRRDTNGQIEVPSTPSGNTKSASKGYVDNEIIKCVPKTRTISGIDLENDIESLELSQSLKVKENLIKQFVNKDSYYPTNNVSSVGQVFSPNNFSSSTGTYCLAIDNLIAKTKYKIVGKGNSGYIKTYVITDNDNKVTRFTTESSTNVEITIAENEKHLYVNLYQYNESTDGVWRVDEQYLTEIVNFVNDIANEKIYKISKYNNLIANSGWNLNIAIGTVVNLSTPTEYNGVYCALLPLRKNCKYILSGKGGGGVFLQYALFDRDSKLIYKTNPSTNTRGSFTPINLPDNACYIAINFDNYDEDFDYLLILEDTSLETISSPLKDKEFVFFGDSISMLKDFSKTNYPEYFKQLSHSTIHNIGIGGTRLTQRATPVDNPTSSNESFAALDLVSIIDSIVSGDFSKQEAAANWIDTNASIGYWNKVVPVINDLANIDFEKITAIIILIGTNDWAANVNLGTSGDNNKISVFGAINYIIEQLLSKYPNLNIYWFTPIVRWEGSRTLLDWCDNKENSNNITLKQFADSILSEVKKQHIQSCNLYQELGWNMYNFSYYFNDDDGVHPYKGFKDIANKVLSFVISNKNFGD